MKYGYALAGCTPYARAARPRIGMVADGKSGLLADGAGQIGDAVKKTHPCLSNGDGARLGPNQGTGSVDRL